MLFTQYLPYTGYLPTIYMIFRDHHAWIVPNLSGIYECVCVGSSANDLNAAAMYYHALTK